MAQTKTRTSRTASSRSSNARSKSASARRKSTSRNGSTARRSSRSTARRSRSASPSNGRNAAQSAKDTVSTGAQNAAQGVTTVARKAIVPVLAGGAAVAGLAGAAVLTKRSNRRRKVLGVTLPKPNGLNVDAQKITGAVTDAAKRADQFGQRVSRVASGVQQVSETADRATKKS
jgi:hypothetical protein